MSFILLLFIYMFFFKKIDYFYLKPHLSIVILKFIFKTAIHEYDLKKKVSFVNILKINLYNLKKERITLILNSIHQDIWRPKRGSREGTSFVACIETCMRVFFSNDGEFK